MHKDTPPMTRLSFWLLALSAAAAVPGIQPGPGPVTLIENGQARVAIFAPARRQAPRPPHQVENQIAPRCTRETVNELGTGGLLAPVVLCRKKD
jgi:hypothetical protein